MLHSTTIIDISAIIGKGTKIWHYVQIRENAVIGNNCILGKNVYIDKNVRIGNHVKIQNNVSVYSGTTIQDNVFVGPHVVFANDRWPRAINSDGTLKGIKDWHISPIMIGRGASIGANSTILPGVTIGKNAMIGAGAVVTKDVPDSALVYGNPARIVKRNI